MAVPKIANKKNVRNEKTSIYKHEKICANPYFLFLGLTLNPFDPESHLTLNPIKIANKKNVRNEKTSIYKHEKICANPYFLFLGLTLNPILNPIFLFLGLTLNPLNPMLNPMTLNPIHAMGDGS